MQSLTIGRAPLSLPDLVIDGNPWAGAFHLPENGLRWPDLTLRKVYTSDSATAPRQMLGYVYEPGPFPLSVYAHGDTTAEVFTAMAELEAALTQWSFDVSITLDGSTRSYVSEPQLPQWGDIDSGMVRAHLARASVLLDVRPA